MRQPLVAGNWKMHGSIAHVISLLNTLKGNCEHLRGKVEITVCPPFIYLPMVRELLAGDNPYISWGAQNSSVAEQGAFTGEISPLMLKEFQCQYVIIGHSERRQIFGETDKLIAEKFTAVLKSGLQAILCVGETLEERQAGNVFAVIEQQLDAVLFNSGQRSLENVVIAYEPVWAIGTGLSATPQQAQEVHSAIRQKVGSINAREAEQLRILYGGSVKPSNASELFAQPDIDGALVGGASLKADEFTSICTATFA